MTTRAAADRRLYIRDFLIWILMAATVCALMRHEEDVSALAGIAAIFLIGAWIGVAIAWAIGGRGYFIIGGAIGGLLLFTMLFLAVWYVHYTVERPRQLLLPVTSQVPASNAKSNQTITLPPAPAVPVE
jgi:hypothetical protein